MLLFRRGEPRLPVRILGVMLLLNAGVTAVLFNTFWPPVDDARRIAAALDAPTEGLLFAFLASLSTARWARGATWAFVGLAIVMGAVAPLAYQSPATPVSAGIEMFRGAVFFVGLALVCFRLAGGAATWERWAAVAFLPRAFYWVTWDALWFKDVFAGTARPQDLLLFVTVPFLAVVSLAAMARLLRRPAPPSPLVAVLVVLTGPAIALAEYAIRQVQVVDPILIPTLSFMTLGIHRPLFLMVGLAPTLLPAVVKRSLAAALTGGIAMLGLGMLYQGAPAAAVVIGITVGAMTLAIAEVLRPRLEQTGAAPPVFRAPPRKDPDHFSSPASFQGAADGQGPSPTSSLAKAPPPDADRPQWQTLLLALRGSNLPPDEATRGEARLRQKAVVELTGIAAPRVSTIVRELNETAAARLDAHVPSWRNKPGPPGGPSLIQQFRGSVAGMPGVWVYYRLTPQGELLAGTLAGEAGRAPLAEPAYEEKAEALARRSPASEQDPQARP